MQLPPARSPGSKATVGAGPRERLWAWQAHRAFLPLTLWLSASVWEAFHFAGKRLTVGRG